METADTDDFFLEQQDLGERGSLSLLAFLNHVGSHVSGYPPTWVEAEIMSLDLKKDSPSLQLVESDGSTGTVARSPAWIWKSHRERILSKFRKQTGAELASGLRVRLLIKAKLHPQYGFSLVVQDIDPQYTLGDMEQRLNELRQTLKEKGFYDLNRTQFARPTDFFHVAVLSPGQAASLADFRAIADRLENNGLCRFTYLDAFFQGEQCVESIRNALKEIVRQHRKETPFCALCIIRGGGAAVNLAELNHLHLAHAICCAPLPVLTGIGHEPDYGLLDEVANSSFHTPSKLALYIQQMVIERTREGSSDWMAIQHGVMHRLEKERSFIGQAKAYISSKSSTVLTQARKNVEKDQKIVIETRKDATNARLDIEFLRQSIFYGADTFITKEKSLLEKDVKNTVVVSQEVIGYAQEQQYLAWNQIKSYAPETIVNARKEINLEMQIITGLSPQSTLSRGFSLVRDAHDKIVTTLYGALKEESLIIQFADGRISVSNQANICIAADQDDKLQASEGHVCHE